MLKLEGTIVITRDAGTGRNVTISITDKGSNCVAAEVEMTGEQFADALFSRYTDCSLEFNDSGTIGAIEERKTEWVPKSTTREFTPKGAIKPFERDGWRGDPNDLNHAINKNNEGTAYRVKFVRHLRDGKPVVLSGAKS